MSELYKCGIIEESLENPKVLEKIRKYFVKSRVQNVPDEVPSVWHVYEYHIPHGILKDLLPELENQVKSEWYIHAFNIHDDVLYVVLKGKSFRLQTNKDSGWDEMIEYGEKVGCRSKWTRNIPLSV